MTFFTARVCWVSLSVCAALIIAVLVFYCYKYMHENGPSLELVEQAIAENVSQGENKDKAHIWLTNMGWEYYHSNTNHRFDNWREASIADLAQVDKRDVDSWTRVIINDVSRGFFLVKRIIVYCFLDMN